MAEPNDWWPWVRANLDKFITWILTGNVTENSVKVARFVILGSVGWSLMMAILVHIMGYNGESVILSPLAFQFHKLGTSSSGRSVEISGEVNKVYKGFDGDGVVGMGKSDSIELIDALQNKFFLEEKCFEASMKQRHAAENINKCYSSFLDYDGRIYHVITEYFRLGNLVQEFSQNDSKEYTAIKNWCRRLLMDRIQFIHSNLYCDSEGDNMVITGKTARVVLGKFGFSIYVEQGSCQRHYDSYTIGMCVLEWVTREPLYRDCTTKREFLAGFKSRAVDLVLNKVTSTKILQVLNKCFTGLERSSA